MFELKVIAFFSAAHSLREYKGKCENLHGHNWKVETIVERKELDRRGLALDFKELKSMLKEVLDELDHKDLSALSLFKTDNPSSENIARFIYQRLKPVLRAKDCKIKKVIVWEQRDYAASYYEEES